MARKAFKPTPEQEAQVEALAGYGIRHDEIGQYLAIDPKTLRKHFRPQLDIGLIKANASVARSLHAMATSGNVAAAIFWMKARAGWREKVDVGLTGPGGGPIQTFDLTKASNEDLKRLESILATIALAESGEGGDPPAGG